MFTFKMIAILLTLLCASVGGVVAYMMAQQNKEIVAEAQRKQDLSSGFAHEREMLKRPAYAKKSPINW